MFGSVQTMIIFPVKVFIFRYYAMMNNTLAKKCRKSPKNRHIRPPFSPFCLRKCLTNSGRYIYRMVLKRIVIVAICSLGTNSKQWYDGTLLGVWPRDAAGPHWCNLPTEHPKTTLSAYGSLGPDTCTLLWNTSYWLELGLIIDIIQKIYAQNLVH